MYVSHWLKIEMMVGHLLSAWFQIKFQFSFDEEAIVSLRQWPYLYWVDDCHVMELF